MLVFFQSFLIPNFFFSFCYGIKAVSRVILELTKISYNESLRLKASWPQISSSSSEINHFRHDDRLYKKHHFNLLKSFLKKIFKSAL